jgi:hypothetical protein
MLIADDNDIAAVAAIAAIRSTFINHGFTPEATATITTLAGANLNGNLINKTALFHVLFQNAGKPALVFVTVRSYRGRQIN